MQDYPYGLRFPGAGSSEQVVFEGHDCRGHPDLVTVLESDVSILVPKDWASQLLWLPFWTNWQEWQSSSWGWGHIGEFVFPYTFLCLQARICHFRSPTFRNLQPSTWRLAHCWLPWTEMADCRKFESSFDLVFFTSGVESYTLGGWAWVLHMLYLASNDSSSAPSMEYRSLIIPAKSYCWVEY